MVLFFKALHVVGYVAWFAGLFYLVRMFVYHEEAFEREQPERDIMSKQYGLMEWRVYKIICNPALGITWGAGLVMIFYDLLFRDASYFLSGTPGWLSVKLVLLLGLTAYHFWCWNIHKKLERGERHYTSWQFRLLNEVPTLLLISIVYIATYGKLGRLNYLYFVLGLAGFIAILYLGARAYKRARKR